MASIVRLRCDVTDVRGAGATAGPGGGLVHRARPPARARLRRSLPDQPRPGPARPGRHGRPAGLVPRAGARGAPGRAVRARRPGVGSAASSARQLAPTLSAMAGGPIDAVAPDDHGHVADQHRHRPHPRRARRRGLPDGDARRGAQRPALEHVGGRRPPPHRARGGAAAAPVPRQLRARRRQDRVRRAAASRCAHLAGVRHVGWRLPSSLAVEVRRAPGARASRSSTPTTTGSTRWPTSTAWDAHYDAELRGHGPAGGRHGRRAAARRRPARHRRPRAGRRAGDAAARPRGRAGSRRLLSGEGRFRWLHARPGARPSCSTPPPPPTASRAWVVPVEQVVDEGWLGPTVDERRPLPPR